MAAPANLNTDVVYHGPSSPPDGKAWVTLTVTLPGITTEDLTLARAELLREALADDLTAHVAGLDGFAPSEVLIMHLSGSADMSRASAGAPRHARRRLSGSQPAVAVEVNLQVAQSKVRHAHRGHTGTGRSCCQAALLPCVCCSWRALLLLACCSSCFCLLLLLSLLAADR